jgi:hypothetical protein
MRLLQLATGPDQLIDLHPNVTIVGGLDPAARRALTDTIEGLAKGRAPTAKGLLEAHGVLFDLSDEMLSLLDVDADGLRPLVVADDLPLARQDPRARERAAADRALAEVDERWFTAGEADRRAQAALTAAAEARDLARRNEQEAEAGAAERIRLIDELTGQLDQAIELRRRLLDRRSAITPEAERALAAREEVESSTVDVRDRHREAALRCSELAARLDEARLGLDPMAEEEAAAAEQELARVEAEVEAERLADARARETTDDDGEPPAERLARVQERIEELEKRLAAFGPAEVAGVLNAYEHLRARHDGELVPSVEAEALADEIAALDADLTATAAVGVTTVGAADARARVDAAREALLEAEQAARTPELDQAAVDRLEDAHAALLNAIDRADGRFAGGRAQRRVDAARGVEHAILSELGFASYSDYMMGYSLLNVDPEKEAALDAARANLSAAEDAWRLIEAETDAELARAERMDRRRQLVEDGRSLLGRRVSSAGIIDELRAHRVAADIPASVVDDLRLALEDVGVALEDDELPRDELLLLAEAWLDETRNAAVREQELRSELATLGDERVAALAAVEAESARAVDEAAGTVEQHREERLSAASAAVRAMAARLEAHREAAALVESVTADLAAASEAEQEAGQAAAGAEAAVAEAAARAEELTAELRQIEDDLAALAVTEEEANEHLQSLSAHETATPEALAAAVASATQLWDAADERAKASAAALEALQAERDEAIARLDTLRDAPVVGDEGPVAEEVEWYLLARLAAQRSVSLGGSVPLVLDDALGGLDEVQLTHVLGRLERMADAVQVIVISDDPQAGSWAMLAGQDRAAIVRPQPA